MKKERCSLLQICQQKKKLIKHQWRTTVTQSHKENDKSPETKLEVEEFCHLIERELKIAVMKNWLNKLFSQ